MKKTIVKKSYKYQNEMRGIVTDYITPSYLAQLYGMSFHTASQIAKGTSSYRGWKCIDVLVTEHEAELNPKFTGKVLKKKLYNIFIDAAQIVLDSTYDVILWEFINGLEKEEMNYYLDEEENYKWVRLVTDEELYLKKVEFIKYITK